jgi:hypothetical protein
MTAELSGPSESKIKAVIDSLEESLCRISCKFYIVHVQQSDDTSLLCQL